jgi:hypothetical protein
MPMSSYRVVGAWADGQAVQLPGDADMSATSWYHMMLRCVAVTQVLHGLLVRVGTHRIAGL